ncbi:NAD(P)/FAD-dependent oxidoreductase [Actinomycetospora aeridis]|uniref:FAD-dependent oxidoreductase n=1 Tax=Actinomycetospora aeridis TaxID=3129231 RepID=A0ABU8N8A3_9PSEU
MAVIGSGAAGLSAAHNLREHATVTLYEAADRPGGHAHTVEVSDAGRVLGLDTAFIVYNEPNYPELMRLFTDLGVEGVEHPGRFSFYDLDTGSCYVSDDFTLTEEEVRRTCPPEFLGLWREAQRFHRESARDFVRRRVDMPLGEYLERNGYSEEFRHGFVVMMCSTAWVVPAEKIWEMPAATIIAFFMAHGSQPLGGSGVPWRTVRGGSITYVRRAVEELRAAGGSLELRTPVHGVRTEPDGSGVEVRTARGSRRFDQVVVATHADQALAVLDEPTDLQRRLLSTIRYHPSTAILHTDPAVMPADRDRWRSWNYGRITRHGEPLPWVVYHLNQLHRLDATTDYLVSVESPIAPRDETVISEIPYSHPTFDLPARQVQFEIDAINEGSPVKFAGSYFHSRSFGPDSLGNHDTAVGAGRSAAECVVRDLPTTTGSPELVTTKGGVR